MDPDNDAADPKQDDVDMIVPPQTSAATEDQANGEDGSSPSIAGANDLTSDSPQTQVAEHGLPIRGGDDNHGSEITHTEVAQRQDAPPLAEQIQIIQSALETFQNTPAQEGDSAYLVSRKWLKKPMDLADNGKNTGTDSEDAAIAPVDNTDIIQASFTDAVGQEFVKLKPGLGLDDFELFPKTAWDTLLQWYGLADGQRPIIRTAHNTAPDTTSLPNIQYEFYPPVFSIHRVWSSASPLPIEQSLKQTNPPPPLIVHSSSYRLHDFLKEAKNRAGVPLNTKVRVWRVLQTLPAGETESSHAGLSTPPSSPGPPDLVPGSFPNLLVEVTDFLKLEKGVHRELVEAHDSTHHANYNGSRSLALSGLAVDQALVLDENTGKKDEWVTNCVARANGKDKGIASRGSSNSLMAQNDGTRSGGISPAPGPMTRGRSKQLAKSGKTLGCVGLTNLGNTCYMNSALQCVRSVEELTKYFLVHEADNEINAENPLSFNGEVAMAYGRLLENIYRDPPQNSVAPREFKNVIGRHAPQFSGYGQQDSQEFLGFLLDGLQEDLNRIKKKPYIEKPDSTDEMIGNPAAIKEMADKVWDITKKRDDSVIADLFTGLYQSTLVCPVCSKVSITFDPFNNLTLPLPLASLWTHKVKYYPLNDLPVMLTVELNKNSSIKAMKEFVSARVGVPVSRLMAGEEWKDKFFKLYKDSSSVSEEITGTDLPAVHELEAVPTNVPLRTRPQKYRSLLEPDSDPDDPPSWEEPASERLVVPVLHREGKHTRRKPAATVPAHFIVLTVEEARSEDVIRRKILEKIATFSTYGPLHEDESAENTEPEMVNASSDGDSHLVAKSVEGEEELVDVTMNDAASSPASTEYPRQLKKFNNRRPKFMDPKQFLLPQLQSLFELSFFSENDSNIPCGWSSVHDTHTYPKLSSRLPPPPPSDVEMNSPTATWDGSEDSDEIADSQSNLVTAATRMVDESSSDSASDIPAINTIHQRNPARFNKNARRKGKPRKTYGKGAQRRVPKHLQNQSNNYLRQTDSPEVEASGGPLLRYGEGIIVDWSEDTMFEVFGGADPADHEGMPTFTHPEELQDEDLRRTQEKRNRRRASGITLDDCLAEFEKEEILSEQDTWYCPRCKEHRRASKKFDLWKTPDILAVHLKRFSSAGHRREKLDELVDFPIEGLDLTSRVINKEDGKQEIYDLFAVDDHWGGLGGGHYTAFAKNFIDGNWYNYNDTSVSLQKDVSKVVTPAAYLLFYRRRSDVALGGPRFQEICDRYNNERSTSDDEESGEDQRLGQGSSPRGSSSASQTGAGATLRSGKAGSGSVRAIASEDNNGGALMLPDYDAADGLPGMNSWQNNGAAAEDEGIGMDDWNGDAAEPIERRGLGNNLSDVVKAGWNFANLPPTGGGLARSEAGEEDGDVDSTTAQNDDDSSLAEDMADEEGSFGPGPLPRRIFTGDMLEEQQDGSEPGGDYVLPDEPHPVMFDVEAPPPSYDGEVGLSMSMSESDRDVVTTVVTAEQIADEVGHAEHVDQAATESRVTEIRIEDSDEEGDEGTKAAAKQQTVRVDNTSA